MKRKLCTIVTKFCVFLFTENCALLFTDYTRIITKDNDIYEGLVWGFRFEDETEDVTLEVWTEDYIFKVSDIVSIEECKE